MLGTNIFLKMQAIHKNQMSQVFLKLIVILWKVVKNIQWSVVLH